MFPKPKYNLESVAELIAERLDSRQITLGAFAAPKYSFWALLLTGPAGFSISFVTLVTCISLGLIQWTTFASNSRLEGVLADPEGKPVQGLMVRLKNGPAALTDENGSYAFDKIRPGPKSLVVSYGTDHITRDVRVIPNRTTVANVIYPLSIARVGRLVGMLTTPLGQPIKGVEVKNRVGGASVSDEAGRFQLHDIPVGRQMIEVQTRSGNATLSQNVLIERDKATEITLVYDEHRAMMGVFSITAPINGIRLDIADHRTEGTAKVKGRCDGLERILGAFDVWVLTFSKVENEYRVIHPPAIIDRTSETWFSEITAGALGFTIRDVDDYEIVAVAAVSKSNLRSFAAVKDLAMLPPHIRSNIVSTPTRSEANLPQGEKLALKAWKALAQGDEAQSLGDRASGTNHFERAILDAEECIREFDARARDRERVLESASMPKPPLGDVSNADKMRMFAEGSLNGVATCYYIKGRSLERLGRYAEARDAYSNAMYFTYARTWDPRSDFFWSPSEFASDRLNFLKEQKIIP